MLVWCWFRCIPVWERLLLSCIHYDFPNILSSMKSAFPFFPTSSHIVTLQSFGGCLTISIVYVQSWKETQKKPTVSTNQVFILRLLLTALITELRKSASYPHDISLCCYAWCSQSPWPLCFWKICPNSASTSKESLKVKSCYLLSSCTANMHKMHELVKIIAIAGVQKGRALGPGKNVCANDSPASVFSKSVPTQAFPP